MDSIFSDLYTTYYQRVYYAALKITKDQSFAEDIVQETFIKAYAKLDEVEEEKKVGAWLATIATRKAIDLLRKEKRLVTLPVEDLPLSQAAFDVEEFVEQRSLMEYVHHRITTLPPKLRVVLQLSCLEGLKEKEIAEKLEISASCVKSRLYRARLALKEKTKTMVDYHSTA